MADGPTDRRVASCHTSWGTSARQAAALVALLGGKFSKEGAWKLGVGTDTVSDVLTSSSSSSVPPAANDSRDRDISAANTKYIFVCIMLSLCRCPSWQEAATEWQQKKNEHLQLLGKMVLSLRNRLACKSEMGKMLPLWKEVGRTMVERC